MNNSHEHQEITDISFGDFLFFYMLASNIPRYVNEEFVMNVKTILRRGLKVHKTDRGREEDFEVS